MPKHVKFLSLNVKFFKDDISYLTVAIGIPAINYLFVFTKFIYYYISICIALVNSMNISHLLRERLPPMQT